MKSIESKVKTFFFLTLITEGLTAFLFCTTNAQTIMDEGRPNIILILADDLRYDALSITGHPVSKTPNIDRLAHEGVMFKNSFVTNSLCCPSRATILTGLYSHVHKVISNKVPLDTTFENFPRLLQSYGYENAYIGKFHIQGGWRYRRFFSRWVSFVGQGLYINPLVNIDGVDTQMVGHLTDILNTYSLEFINRNHSGPFFLFLAHKAPHAPYIPQDRFLGRYDSAEISLPVTRYEDLSNKPSFLQCYPFTGNENTIRRYLETILGIDENVGMILSALEQKGILDNTMIILTSDNGLLLGEHTVGDKRVAYEESMRIPMLIRYPAWFQPGSVDSINFALNLDIPLTILDAAQIPPANNMQGTSLRKFLSKEEERRIFLYEYFRDPAPDSSSPSEKCIPTLHAVRTPKFKFITYTDTIPYTDELYDLEQDPLEINNLIDNPSYNEVVATLRHQLDSLRVATGETTGVDNIPLPNSYELFQNYPNPFNAETIIRYALPKRTHVVLKVYDVLGREITTLVNEIQDHGYQQTIFDGSSLPSGVYFYRLFADVFQQSGKMLLIR